MKAKLPLLSTNNWYKPNIYFFSGDAALNAASSAPVSALNTPAGTLAALPLAQAAAMPIRGACRQEMYNLESRLSQGHFSSRIWCLQSGRTKFRECVVCRACATCLPGGAKRRQTPNWCRKCDKALCVDKLSLVKQVTCFQLFHSVTRLETLVIET